MPDLELREYVQPASPGASHLDGVGPGSGVVGIDNLRKTREIEKSRGRCAFVRQFRIFDRNCFSIGRNGFDRIDAIVVGGIGDRDDLADGGFRKAPAVAAVIVLRIAVRSPVSSASRTVSSASVTVWPEAAPAVSSVNISVLR